MGWHGEHFSCLLETSNMVLPTGNILGIFSREEILSDGLRRVTNLATQTNGRVGLMTGKSEETNSVV